MASLRSWEKKGGGGGKRLLCTYHLLDQQSYDDFNDMPLLFTPRYDKSFDSAPAAALSIPVDYYY